MIFCINLQVYVRHPELAAAKANRDYVFKQVCEAVNTISDVAQGKGPSITTNPYEGPGELAAALDDFDVRIGLFIFIFLWSVFCYVECYHLIIYYLENKNNLSNKV